MLCEYCGCGIVRTHVCNVENLQIAVDRLKNEARDLRAALSEEPRNKTLLPDWAQRLWEAMVRLADPATLGELKIMFNHIERMEKNLCAARERLKADGHSEGCAILTFDVVGTERRRCTCGLMKE